MCGFLCGESRLIHHEIRINKYRAHLGGRGGEKGRAVGLQGSFLWLCLPTPTSAQTSHLLCCLLHPAKVRGGYHCTGTRRRQTVCITGRFRIRAAAAGLTPWEATGVGRGRGDGMF